MTTPPDSKSVRLSQKIYEYLLAFYPRNHRREYGGAMAQLFRDQSRDAWTKSRGWGLAALWLRVSIDTIKSASMEHFHNLNQQKSMLNRTLFSQLTKSSPRAVFAVLFAMVLIFTGITVGILPKAYSSKARVKIYQDARFPPQTELLVIQSEMILDRVISDLDLNHRWRQKYHTAAAFKTPESRALLKKMIRVSQIRDTTLIDITVSSDDNQEAAVIANSLATTYAKSRRANFLAQVVPTGILDEDRIQIIEIIDTAEPALRPIRPNIPLNIFYGILMAAIIGGAGVMVTRILQRPRGLGTVAPVS